MRVDEHHHTNYGVGSNADDPKQSEDKTVIYGTIQCNS
jgi:hypothetical protein